ncbi:hypothetical protein ACTFIR_003890 [Dictyostelium discoideum]
MEFSSYNFKYPFDNYEFYNTCIVLNEKKLIKEVANGNVQENELFWLRLPNQIINFIQDQVFFTFGMPSAIISDNDPLFTSNDWLNWIHNNNITHTTCQPYHHQGNDQAEIIVRIVAIALRKCLISSKFSSGISSTEINSINNDWIGYLKSVQFCINNTILESTSFSPFQILTGSQYTSQEIVHL